MPVDFARCRKLLDASDHDALFIECLGWDRHKAALRVPAPAGEFTLRGFAEKRGFAAFICGPDARGRIPDHQTRAAIDREVTKIAREHIVIFTTAKGTEQVWQWVRRGKDQPIKRREFGWRAGQASGILLERVLPNIAFALAEEERLTLPDVTTRAAAAFDVEKVTKRFFERFQAEHAAFHEFIEGIDQVADRDWYASVMLNRLMFCYFIQMKGLLDGDPDYLRNRLRRLQQTKGKDVFWSFYRHFLLRLFHEGLGQKPDQRKKELDALIGRIPYLNGGLFDIHELEATYRGIQISDEAFERLFAFFDEYRWHLDERPLRENNEINPDVLGYIFEKYINQKQMGAYYTKEDITGYISQNTILPFMLDHAAKNCAIAFKPDSSASVWRLLKEHPDAYIYEPVRRGVIDEQGEVVPLPVEIEAGITDVSKRGGWNKHAPPPFALPTETWREHVARRQRCLELRRKLAAGEVTTVNDLVTLNLDIRQFAEDMIDRCEGPELLRAVWRCLAGHVPEKSNEKHEAGISILDPTCGSGAFLFAALSILEPLYEACLDRMESFVEDLERAKAAGEKVDSRMFADLRSILAQVADHPNQRYFILKSIIVNNLYGADIMEEACEICKLRLFLKLVAQVEEGVAGVDKIEPLPDVDFNIRAGNTLVGFTNMDAVKASMAGRFDFGKDIQRIEGQAEQAATAFRLFREMQTRRGVESKDLADGKRLVRQRLRALDDELNRYLAAEYGVDPDRTKAYKAWLGSHQPFHWLVDFYGIMSSGGFDVIIGNPPYVEYSKIRDTYRIVGFETEPCGNLYAPCVERSYRLLRSGGRFGFIVQAPIVSTVRMQPVRNVLLQRSELLAVSTFDDRPSKLFDGMHHCRLAIILSRVEAVGQLRHVFTTRYHKWYTEERRQLFETLCYSAVPVAGCTAFIPKVRGATEVRLLEKVAGAQCSVGGLLSAATSPHVIYYKITGVGHWFTFTTKPPKFWRDGAESSSTRENAVFFRSAAERDVVYCTLASSLHYWLYQVRTNCRDFNPADLAYPPVPAALAQGSARMSELAKRLAGSLEKTAEVASATYKVGGTVSFQKFRPRLSKDIVDKIDSELGRAFGFGAEEIDFVINYDVKYRLGGTETENEE